MTGFDVLVVGSGFGGSVAALRAAAKRYGASSIRAGRLRESYRPVEPVAAQSPAFY